MTVEAADHRLPSWLECGSRAPGVGDLPAPAFHAFLARVIYVDQDPSAGVDDEVAEDGHPRPNSNYALAVLNPYVVDSC